MSTHSFRHSALTQMSNTLIPLRIVQEVSGHRNLSQLQLWIDRAGLLIHLLKMQSPVEQVTQNDVEKYFFFQAPVYLALSIELLMNAFLVLRFTIYARDLLNL
ncbi:site-specific integrase [Trichocoleus sp. ST-U2]